MGYLESREQQLILDFYFRCGDEEDIARGRDLIASSPEAAKLYAGLEETLTELDSLKYEPCPDNLADLTVARLKLAASAKTVASSSSNRLADLLKSEQDNRNYLSAGAVPAAVKPRRFWHPLMEMSAAAAAVVLIAGILVPSFGSMRQHSRQVACENNLRQIGQAMAAFAGDNSGRMGDVRVQAGSPWWKIGYQGPENHSNTRYPWQLVKGGYVSGTVFLCGGQVAGKRVQYQPDQIAALNDFPSRDHINYSFLLLCDKNQNITQRSRRIIAADSNPVFQKIPSQNAIYQKLNEFERILLNEQLRQMMSSNHWKKGQNVLYCDGSVEFMRTRIVNGDDIFTVKDVEAYTGKEAPCDPADIFLVP